MVSPENEEQQKDDTVACESDWKHHPETSDVIKSKLVCESEDLSEQEPDETGSIQYEKQQSPTQEDHVSQCPRQTDHINNTGDETVTSLPVVTSHYGRVITRPRH